MHLLYYYIIFFFTMNSPSLLPDTKQVCLEMVSVAYLIYEILWIFCPSMCAEVEWQTKGRWKKRKIRDSGLLRVLNLSESHIFVKWASGKLLFRHIFVVWAYFEKDLEGKQNIPGGTRTETSIFGADITAIGCSVKQRYGLRTERFMRGRRLLRW